jgi:hypothetical protein
VSPFLILFSDEVWRREIKEYMADALARARGPAPSFAIPAHLFYGRY